MSRSFGILLEMFLIAVRQKAVLKEEQLMKVQTQKPLEQSSDTFPSPSVSFQTIYLLSLKNLLRVFLYITHIINMSLWDFSLDKIMYPVSELRKGFSFTVTSLWLCFFFPAVNCSDNSILKGSGFDSFRLSAQSSLY